MLKSVEYFKYINQDWPKLNQNKNTSLYFAQNLTIYHGKSNDKQWFPIIFLLPKLYRRLQFKDDMTIDEVDIDDPLDFFHID